MTPNSCEFGRCRGRSSDIASFCAATLPDHVRPGVFLVRWLTKLIPRSRRAALPNGALVVVRGMTQDEPAISIRQAVQFQRRFPDFGRYGLSGFVAANDDEVVDLGAHHLDPFARLFVFEVSELIGAGFEVVATFRNPHVTITFVEEPEAGVGRLLALRHEIRNNPAFREEGR